ncbi:MULTISPECIES: glycosyltransferase family 39 protein [unclassified Luteococcus]|uniref:glycosyltransferase family 39 protein n=1 Tax=unclassified Luteococcus TaxID=2639923 RepID=UPI00313D20A4
MTSTTLAQNVLRRTRAEESPPRPGATARLSRAGGAARSERPSVLHRASLAVLLLATAALYLIGLSESGYANSFYSAAAQAGGESWKAWFFGSLDAGNAITVDKPPAALWLMGLSVRLFGLSSWSILLPEALLGVASVAVLYATVRRSLAGRADGSLTHSTLAHWAALGGAATLALTPAATLMFRFNNPDALLVFLEVAAAWFVVRASQTASRKHLALAGAMIGLGFLTKMLQAFLVLPAFVVAYAVAAPTTWKRKITDLFLALGAMIASFGWYVALFELVPSSWRPYMGGSQNNSLLELAFGYNGLGRITGEETGGLGNGGSSSGVGVLRIFQSISGGMISWLVPAALLLGVFAWAVLGRTAWANLNPRRSPDGFNTTPATQASAGLVVWLGWLLVTAAVFSAMSGIYHDYYVVALAPGIAGAVALGTAILWQRRDLLLARVGLALASCATGVWAVRLMMRAGGSWTTLGGFIAVAATLAALGLLFVDKLPEAVTKTSLVLAVVAALAGPASYSVNTAQTAHTGSIVTAGPVSGGMGGGGGGRMGGGTPPGGATGQAPTGTAPAGNTQTGSIQTGSTQTAQTGGPGGGGPGGGGGMGGMLGGATVSDELKTLLTQGSGSYTWVAATVGAQNAASYQLATGSPVIALGGFNGTDPAPTLAQFKAMVAAGQVHWFIGSGSTGMPGSASSGASDASEIAAWVAQNFTAQSIDGTTVYDLTAG